MKTPAVILTAFLCMAGHLTAAEGGSADWTQVAPADPYLMGDYEGKWLDAPKGHYYQINKPLAAQVINAARPPMEWQTYDMDYSASDWKNAKKIFPPRITVRLNGVLIHHDQEIPHATAHAFETRMNEPKGEGPLRLQDHGNAIQFRNIWILPGRKN